MATTQQNKQVAYGALATSIAGAIAIVYTAVVDLQMANDPEARPDACTGTRCTAIERDLDVIKSEHRQFRKTLDEIEEYLEEHKVWGENLARKDAEWRGRIEAEHQEFHRKFENMYPYRSYQR